MLSYRTSDEIHICGNNAFIIASIILVVGLCRKTRAVAAEVDEEDVARLRRPDKLGQSQSDVLAGGLGVGMMSVNENNNVLF